MQQRATPHAHLQFPFLVAHAICKKLVLDRKDILKRYSRVYAEDVVRFVCGQGGVSGLRAREQPLLCDAHPR